MSQNKKAITVRRGRETLTHTYTRQYRTKEILSLAHRGYSINKIANTLHLSYDYVRRIYWDMIESFAEENKQYASLLAARQLSEIRSMIDSISDKVHTGDLDAIETTLKLMDKEAKLLSLYPKDIAIQTEFIVVNFPSAQTPARLDNGMTIHGTAIQVDTNTADDD